jgi:hypothetical protein
MYGITFGNEKVQKWITSFMTSVLSSVFLTSPIQLTLNAIFMATLCRNSTDLFEDKVKEDSKIDNSAISNNQESVQENVRYGLDATSVEVADHVKKKRLTEKKIKDVLKRCLIQAIFLSFLYITAFSVRNKNSFNYKNYLSNRFLGDVQSVLELFLFFIKKSAWISVE